MINLFVSGIQLDLFKSEVFAVSKAVSKLGEFNLRHGDVSINFSVPSTAKNVTIFGHLSDLNNFNKNAFRRFDGQLIEDESVISNGYFQVLKINPTEAKIELRFYGGNSDWFNLIRKRDINGTYLNTEIGTNKKSYSLQSLNHKFEPASIVSSWDNEDGYFYFPVDNGKNSGKTTKFFTLEDFQVGVFQHTIVENIFDSIGIKLNGSLFNDPLYSNTLVNKPSDLTEFESQNNEKSYRQAINEPIGKDTYQPITFNLNDQDSQWDGNTFTSVSDIDNLNFQLRNIANHSDFFVGQYGDLEVKCEYTINGVPQTDIEVILTIEDTSNQYQFVFVLFEQEDFDFTNVKQNDTFVFSIRNVNYSTPGIQTFWFTQAGLNSDPSLRAFFDYQINGANTAFDITNAIPEINQANFIKDVMFRHGVISQYDAKTRTLTLNKFEDIDKNKPNAVDFSDKIDLAKPPVFDFTKLLSNFKKTSKIIYKQDDSDLLMSLFRAVFKSNLGDAVLEIDNDNLSGEGTIYESEFSGTLQVLTMTENFYIPSIAIFKPTDGGEFELQDLNARIFVKAGNTPVNEISNQYTSIDLDGVLYNNIGYAFFAKQLLTDEVAVTTLNSNLETLSFQNINKSTTNYIGRTLIEKNYGLYFNILNNPIHLTINLNLTALDIEKIDFFTPIWLNFSLDSGYYYLDNVSQYKGDGTTTSIELVKI